MKIAHALLNRNFTSKSSSGGPLTGDQSIKPGDRVALVYPNNDPINFMCAFYGCLQACVVPVPIEVPLTRRDAGLQQVGFLLGSCSIQYALTSDACLKGKKWILKVCEYVIKSAKKSYTYAAKDVFYQDAYSYFISYMTETIEF